MDVVIRKWIACAVLLMSSPVWAVGDKLWPEDVDAVILLDENEFEIQGKNKAKFRKHRKIKVYNENGQKYGRVVIHESMYTKCKDISGEIRDASGKLIQKLDKRDIQKGAYFPNFVLYDDAKYQAFELKASAFPYVITYTYEKEYKSLFFWPSWYPQMDVPVLKSTYTLVGADKVKYQIHSTDLDIAPVKEKGSERIWQLTKIKPRTKERLMPPEDRIQMGLYFAPTDFKIDESVGSFASWDGVAKWYGALAAGRYELPPDAVKKVKELVAGVTSDREKVAIIYRYLQDQTRYVAIELGIGAWQPYSAESVFENKYGDCKDLSTFMVAMLKTCGITAYPTLIGTRDRGMMMREFPSNQFNHCIAFVPLEQDSIWLECTADLLAAGDLPAMDEGCDVLVVKDGVGEVIRTPESSSDDNRQVSKITGELSKFGTLTFSGELQGTGNVASQLRGSFYNRKPEDRERYLARKLGAFLPKLDLANYEIDHLDTDFEQPLVIRASGKFGKFGTLSAKRLFVNPNVISRVEPEDVPREKDRKFDVYHSFAYSQVDSLSIAIPKGYVLETAPEPREVTTPFGSFKTTCDFTDGELIHTRTFRLEQKKIPLVQYEAYVAFMKDIVKVDQTPIVFVASGK